jgi:hypothetical protein
MNLPEPCEKCAPLNGAWMETENGLRRCECERGQALKAARNATIQTPRPPVLGESAAAMFAEMLAGIGFYPSEAGARAFIASEIAAICNSENEAAWLVTQMHRRHSAKWPGVTEMRAVFCTYAQPLDGVMAISNATEEQIEQEYITSLALPAAPMRKLSAGEPVIASPSIASTVSDLVRQKDMNRVIKNIPAPQVREIPVVRVTAANAITAADIELEVQKLRGNKAAEAIG